jgi:lipid-binding SYLF domain-containing protein
MHIIQRVAVGMTALAITTTAIPALAAGSNDEAKRLNKSAAVLTELRSAPDAGIPERIWNKAECVVVIPSLKKAGFIVGGETGNGVMSCRHGNQWGAPVFMELTKASFGLQAGVQSTELVLLVMNKRGIDKLLNNKVTLGADASIAAGPVGRTASAATDAQMTAEMLAYSRSRGLFAGIDLSGGALKPDKSANERVYGRNVSAREIATGAKPVQMTAEGRAFTDALGRGVAATTGVK